MLSGCWELDKIKCHHSNLDNDLKKKKKLSKSIVAAVILGGINQSHGSFVRMPVFCPSALWMSLCVHLVAETSAVHHTIYIPSLFSWATGTIRQLDVRLLSSFEINTWILVFYLILVSQNCYETWKLSVIFNPLCTLRCFPPSGRLLWHRLLAAFKELLTSFFCSWQT